MATSPEQFRVIPDALGPLAREELLLPRSGLRLQVTRPIDTDALLDLAESDPEKNLPYWAEIWPSGVALADAILKQPELVSRKRVLELGCGIGITAVAASHAGGDLVISDYSADALVLAQNNLRTNGGYATDALQVNWRRTNEAFDRTVGEGFPVVLAADVLYESRDIEPLLAFFLRVVAPGGLLWLAEPGRDVAGRFLERAALQGWSGLREEHDGPWPDPKDEGVIVRIYQLRRG
jgi:predicted nicotinamide N-methyase